MSQFDDFVSEHPGDAALIGAVMLRQGQASQARSQAQLLQATKDVNVQLAALKEAEAKRASLEKNKYQEEKYNRFRLQCVKFMLADSMASISGIQIPEFSILDTTGEVDFDSCFRLGILNYEIAFLKKHRACFEDLQDLTTLNSTINAFEQYCRKSEFINTAIAFCDQTVASVSNWIERVKSECNSLINVPSETKYASGVEIERYIQQIMHYAENILPETIDCMWADFPHMCIDENREFKVSFLHYKQLAELMDIASPFNNIHFEMDYSLKEFSSIKLEFLEACNTLIKLPSTFQSKVIDYWKSVYSIYKNQENALYWIHENIKTNDPISALQLYSKHIEKENIRFANLDYVQAINIASHQRNVFYSNAPSNPFSRKKYFQKLPEYSGATKDFISSQIRKSDNECKIIIRNFVGCVLFLLVCVSVYLYNYYQPENQLKIAQSKVSIGNDIDSATQASPLLSKPYYKKGLDDLKSGNRISAKCNFEKAVGLGSLESSFELGKMNIEEGRRDDAGHIAGWELVESASKSNSPALLKSIIEFYSSWSNRVSDTIPKMFYALSQLQLTGISDFEKYKDSIITLNPMVIKRYQLLENFLSSEYSFHKGQIVEGYETPYIVVPFLVIEGKLTPTKIDPSILKPVN